MLDIRIHSKNGILFLKLSGKLNKETICKMKELINIIKEIGTNNIVINIKNLEEIDRIGRKELEKYYKLAKTKIIKEEK